MCIVSRKGSGFADKFTTKELDAKNVFADIGTFNQLCVADAAGKTCITRSQLDAMLAASAAGAPGAGSGAPASDPASTDAADSGQTIIVPQDDSRVTASTSTAVANDNTASTTPSAANDNAPIVPLGERALEKAPTVVPGS
jgi:hypothetical protein